MMIETMKLCVLNEVIAEPSSTSHPSIGTNPGAPRSCPSLWGVWLLQGLETSIENASQ